MALCTIRKVSNRNSSYCSDDEKYLATTREQLRYGNGKLHYISREDRSWRRYRVNPPGDFYKVTRSDCPTGSKFENPMFYKGLFDSRARPVTMRYFKRVECRDAIVNRENNMV